MDLSIIVPVYKCFYLDCFCKVTFILGKTQKNLEISYKYHNFAQNNKA